MPRLLGERRDDGAAAVIPEAACGYPGSLRTLRLFTISARASLGRDDKDGRVGVRRSTGQTVVASQARSSARQRGFQSWRRMARVLPARRRRPSWRILAAYRAISILTKSIFHPGIICSRDDE